jgi:aminopeptidase N
MRRHAYGNTRSPQLWDAIEEASQRPVRAVADDFTRQPGVPLIQVQASACRGGEQTITLRQSEFTSLPVSRAPLLWRTPVAVTPLGGARQDLLTDETRTAQARTTCGPVIINPEQIGYFRTLYDRAAFARLTQSFHRIDAADQLGLLYDLRALGRAGSVSAADFFALAAATPADADPLVWTVIANELAVTDGLFAADDRRRSRYRVFARGLLAPVLQRVGWRRRAGEADNVSILRASLFGALSTLRDPAFEAEALSRYQRDDFDGRVRSTLLSAVAAAASPPVFENMLDRARAATETLEKQTLYGALANVRDPALAARVLELAFDDDIDPALGPDMIATVALNHPDLAFSYALSHEAELAARLDPFSLRSFAPSLAVASNDAAMLGRLRHYIDTEIPDTARRGAEAYHAQLDERLSTRERRLSEIGRWLQAASPARP